MLRSKIGLITTSKYPSTTNDNRRKLRLTRISPWKQLLLSHLNNKHELRQKRQIRQFTNSLCQKCTKTFNKDNWLAFSLKVLMLPKGRGEKWGISKCHWVGESVGQSVRVNGWVLVREWVCKSVNQSYQLPPLRLSGMITVEEKYPTTTKAHYIRFETWILEFIGPYTVLIGHAWRRTRW